MKIDNKELYAEQKVYEGINRPIKFKNQSQFPLYALPSSRDFERLIFYLYKNRYQKICQPYDEVWLLHGTHDKSRDIQLNSSGHCSGIVQCKKYKQRLNEVQVSKEFVKYVLQNLNELSDYKGVRDYVLATVEGVNERAMNFVSLVNSGDPLMEVAVDKAVENLLNDKDYNFGSFSYTDEKSKVVSSIKKLRISLMDAEAISHSLEQDNVTVQKFFKIDFVIDQATFEELLTCRQHDQLEKYIQLSELEKQLLSMDAGLGHRLATVKKSTASLIDDYSLNFLAYSIHSKKHSAQLPNIVSSLLGNNPLNADELFVLLVSAFVTDIGMCQPLENVDEFAVRNSHAQLSADFIEAHGATVLNIPTKYISSVKCILLATNGFLIHPENRRQYATNYASESFSVNKINQLYLATIVWLADVLDIENMNSRSLLEKYTRYPNYGTSQSLWNETDFNFTTNIDHETITYSARNEINDQLLYLSLCIRIEHVKVVIEAANSILIKEGKTLPLKFVADGLKSGLKKRIGITIDSHNVLSSLLGKKLYPKEIDAVRELVQNAVDACLANQGDAANMLRIDITLEKKTLVVKDNGIGMDEEVISKYFAKVGRSYHVEMQNDKAIGRFGIGVFSYFMLAPRFIVETKERHGQGLKFKVDVHAPDFFYFYEDAFSDDGTTITIEDLTYDITDDDLAEYLAKTFAYTKVPIYLNGVHMNPQRLLPPEENSYFIQHYIKVEHRTDSESLYFTRINFNDDNIEGWVGAFFPTAIRIDDVRRHFSKGLRYYNKGVYVTQGSGLIGEINFKKGFGLKIDRNNFEDDQELEELKDRVLADVYLAGIRRTVIPKHFFTQFFIFNYWGGHKVRNLYHLLEGEIFPLIFKDRELHLMSLKTLRTNKEGVDLVCATNPIVDGLEASVHTTNKLISVMHIFTDAFYINYFKHIGYTGTMRNDNHTSYYHFQPSDTPKKNFPLSIRQAEFTEFEDDVLGTQFSHTTYFNINHPLCKYLFQISADPKKRQLTADLKELLEGIGSALLNAFDGFREGRRHARVLLFNTKLDDINNRAGMAFKISKEDFPPWMSPFIR